MLCGNRKWLILGPVGSELPVWPEETVLDHMFHLSSTVRDLHRVGWLHCDLSYFNCSVFPAGKAGLIDLGAAKTLQEVCA